MSTRQRITLPRWPEWMERAACKRPGVDPEWFYPERGNWVMAERAKLVCSVCPVRAECQEYGELASREYGVFGGLTPTERKEARRAAREAAA